LIPVAKKFDPDMIIVSAGFDAGLISAITFFFLLL
jgi:acetoin utilization deacetylase AcuC-like enzyme